MQLFVYSLFNILNSVLNCEKKLSRAIITVNYDIMKIINRDVTAQFINNNSRVTLMHKSLAALKFHSFSRLDHEITKISCGEIFTYFSLKKSVVIKHF